jgi:transcription antitermination factor NusG
MKIQERIETSKPVSLANLVDRAGAPRWAVVETNGGHEREALLRLRENGFAAYLPMRAVVSKRSTRAEPLFPNYVLVQLDLTDAGWFRVFTTVGVKRLLTKTMRGGRPMPLFLPCGAVRKILAEEVDGLVQLVTRTKRTPSPFKGGEVVKIVRGSFEGFTGVFASGNAERVMVLLSLLGREVKIEMDTCDAVTLSAVDGVAVDAPLESVNTDGSAGLGKMSMSCGRHGAAR